MRLWRAAIDSSFVFVLALVYAAIEIEIEGPDGWAKNLPTPQNFLGHLSLYHVYMIFLAVCILSGFYYFRNTAIKTESSHVVEPKKRPNLALRILTVIGQILWMLIFFFLIQDLLWFVLNPSYTINGYCASKIPWHTPWLWGIP